MYRPDEPFKELTDYERKDEKGELVDTAGVAVLWEVLPAKYTRQVQYLSEGTSWLNYSTLEKAMTDTGFSESMKHCHTAPVNSPTAMQNDMYMENNGNLSYQPDCIERQESDEQEHIGLLNSNPSVSNGLSGLLTDPSLKMVHTNDNTAPEDITVDCGGGYQFTLTCEQPVTLTSVINKITGETRVMGDLLLTYHLDGGDELVTIHTNEQMEHYLQLPERPNLRVEQLK